MSVTLTIDPGSRNIGLALVRSRAGDRPSALYAACIVAEPKPLKELVVRRAQLRRMRRTRKTRRRRLRRLADALRGIAGAEAIVRFCRRRGYSHDPKRARDGRGADDSTGADKLLFNVSREDFFKALEAEVQRVIAEPDRQRVLAACRRHLNAARLPGRELRPPRFDNRAVGRCRWQDCPRRPPRRANAVEENLRQTLYEWLKPVFGEALAGLEQAEAAKAKSKMCAELDHWCSLLAKLAAEYRKLADEQPDQRDEKAIKKVSALLERRKNELYQKIVDWAQENAPAKAGRKFAEDFEAYCDKKRSKGKQKWEGVSAAGATQAGAVGQKKKKKKKKRGFGNQLDDIVVKGRAGRLQYCREHTEQYIQYFLEGKPIPNREDVLDRDIRSRRQKIVFDRLWALIRGRLLPLAGGRIDRIVVERVAFDVLAGTFADCQELFRTDEEKAAEMYWFGPRHGFKNELEMLRTEFAGRCAYCGQQFQDLEVEHILPRSRFPFDSYLVKVPACRQCNMKKGGRSILEAQMRIHPDAYDAYEQYLEKREVRHYFCDIKKGVLKLLTNGAQNWGFERLLGMIAHNIFEQGKSQNAPRALGRWLAGKLERETGVRPKVVFLSGRHTAAWRQQVLPDYEKAAEKAEGKKRNHAVDAILLGCDFPPVAFLDSQRKWWLSEDRLRRWEEQVKAAAPELADLAGDGDAAPARLPRVEAPPPIRFFEEDLGGGYFKIDLSAFGWNRRRQSGAKVDPVRMITTANGKLVAKREPAQAVLKDLLAEKQRDKRIKLIANRRLRQLLQSDPANAARNYVLWLQRQTARGLRAAKMGNHPADTKRREMLEQFINTPVDDFLRPSKRRTAKKAQQQTQSSDGRGNGQSAAEQTSAAEIPAIIGVCCLIAQKYTKYDVPRCDRNGKPLHYYASQPAIRALYVGYKRRKDGRLDRSKPEIFRVNQVWKVYYGPPGKDQDSPKARKVIEKLGQDSPLHGRMLGQRGSWQEFRKRWHEAFGRLWADLGVEKRFQIAQGAVIEKTDGTCFLVRNFDNTEGWMRGSPWKDIRRVYRSPLHYLSAKAKAAFDHSSRSAATVAETIN